MFLVFQLRTYRLLETIFYKMIPVISIIALVVLRAMERGFLINTGAM